MATRDIEQASFSASSSSSRKWRYDVFLNFRGKDTRKNFTDHLYAALLGRGSRHYEVWLWLLFKVFFTYKNIKIIFKKKLFLISSHQNNLKISKNISFKQNKIK
jgi:hypothetical protein